MRPMRPDEFLAIRDRQQEIIDAAEAVIDKAYQRAENCAPPSRRRRAAPTDIMEGAVIWHIRSESDYYWHVIAEVQYHDDDFKAYVAEDGCRYGLHNAYVEVRP